MISSIVITYNEEKNIRECLQSLKWTDEIIVVDSASSDKTAEIASEFTNKILRADKGTYGEKKNTGIENASGDWILWIDADERITDELKNEILQITGSKETGVEAFLINRKSFFISKFIRHSGWYPDYTMRLFRRSAGIKFDDSKVHETAVYSGKTDKLKSDILHYTDMDFEHYISKLNAYTSLSAEDMKSRKKSASIFDIFFRPAFTFFKMYFLKLGFLDGYMGLVLSSLSGIHVMAKYSKLYFFNKNT
jgi:glycosyltransferase involved in cell wall biosynthesis